MFDIPQKKPVKSMTNAIAFLNDQIESDEIWKSDHKRAMQCADLGDKIKVGLSFFSLFRGTDELWSRGVQSGALPFDADVAKALYGAYRWWLIPCDEVLDATNQFEKEGYTVAGAPEFRAACVTVRGILRTDGEEVIKNLKAARASAA
jgi:hypothetical protein